MQAFLSEAAVALLCVSSIVVQSRMLPIEPSPFSELPERRLPDAPPDWSMTLSKSMPSPLGDLSDIPEGLTLNATKSLISSKAAAFDYDPFRWFTFVNFPNDPVQYAKAFYRVTNSVLAVQLILYKALNPIWQEATKQTPTNPSCLRYFFPDDLNTVKQLFGDIIAGLGVPSATLDARRRCLEQFQWFRYLEFSYDTHPRDPSQDQCTDNTGVIAHYGEYDIVGGARQGYVSLCADFFDPPKPFTAVVPSNFGGPIIEKSCYDKLDEPSYSAAKTLLHELMHWFQITAMWYPTQIEDVVIRLPDGQEGQAYGAYYAMHVKDWALDGKKPLDNVDNYVSLALEMYYQATYQLPDFQDPPYRGCSRRPLRETLSDDLRPRTMLDMELEASCP